MLRHGAAVAALALPLAMPAAAFHRPCVDCDIPYEWDDGAAPPPVAAPLPQGFALTVPFTPGQRQEPARTMLNRYAEVATALGGCLSAATAAGDADWRDLTLRVSFRRDGSVNGVPRVVHMTTTADAAAEARGRDTLLTALSRCSPLALSPSLGRAIAGQIFAIRFVQQRNS